MAYELPSVSQGYLGTTAWEAEAGGSQIQDQRGSGVREKVGRWDEEQTAPWDS